MASKPLVVALGGGGIPVICNSRGEFEGVNASMRPKSTNIEYVLRNLGIKKLFVCGVYTNECISSAVRSAGDLGFDVRMISDATAAITQQLHDATLLTIDKRYCEVITTREAIEELASHD